MMISIAQTSVEAHNQPDSSHMALITLSVTNLRKLPDHRSEMVSQAILGTPVKILARQDDWVYIQTPDDYRGWIESISVVPAGGEKWEAWHRAERVIYTGNTGWIYASPNGQEVISDIVGGAILEKSEAISGWVGVILPDGRKGFVRSNETMDLSKWKRTTKCTAKGLINLAYTYMGIPYLWGGASIKGADCSGFMQSIFFRNGLVLLRDASQQETQGMKVDISKGLKELKPGDLLFFGSKSGNTLHVTHVGLYLGDTEFIHCSGLVRTGSLDPGRTNYDANRRHTLLAAKRIIGASGQAQPVPVANHPWY